MGRTAAVAIALALAGAGLAGERHGAAAGTARQEGAREALPLRRKKGAKQAAPAPDASQSAWVKLCEKATAIKKDKDGKEEKKDLNICLTHHERLDGNTGMVLVSAAVRQVDGQDKQHFMVMVPLGMLLQPGMRASLYPKDIWDKVQKNEKVDESKLKQFKLAYTLCHPAGCTAEMEMTPELLNDLKTGGGLVVFAVERGWAAGGFPGAAQRLRAVLCGQAPIDNKQYGEARRALMQQIAQRQQQIAEEQQKKAKEEPKAAPSAPPAKAAPAPAPKK